MTLLCPPCWARSSARPWRWSPSPSLFMGYGVGGWGAWLERRRITHPSLEAPGIWQEEELTLGGPCVLGLQGPRSCVPPALFEPHLTGNRGCSTKNTAFHMWGECAAPGRRPPWTLFRALGLLVPYLPPHKEDPCVLGEEVGVPCLSRGCFERGLLHF